MITIKQTFVEEDFGGTLPMPVILRKLPFFEDPTSVRVGSRFLEVKPYQIMVWVSLARRKLVVPDPSTPRFPAILDTGFSHNLAIRAEELEAWAGLDARLLPVLGRARLNGIPVQLLAAHLWLYRNQPGQRDVVRPDTPFRLELFQGIAVYPRGAPNAPRLPLLGLRALRQANLHLWINCRKGQVHLSTSRWSWLFG